LRVLPDHEAGIAVVDEAATGDEAVALTRDYSRTSCCWT
jgi:YesN/AraC family two-component response regulator